MIIVAMFSTFPVQTLAESYMPSKLFFSEPMRCPCVEIFGVAVPFAQPLDPSPLLPHSGFLVQQSVYLHLQIPYSSIVPTSNSHVFLLQ